MITILAHKNTDDIDAYIKAILARGNIAVFTNKFTGIVKWVTEWKQDVDGDLIASYSSGKTKCVCPYAVEYTITEKVKE